MKSKKVVTVNIPGIPNAGSAPLERSDGNVRASVEWLVNSFLHSKRPETYTEMDVLITLSVRDLQLLFGGVNIETRVIDTSAGSRYARGDTETYDEV